MIRDLFMVGQRLAGRSDRRLRRGVMWALLEALTVAIPYALVLWVLLEAIGGRLTLEAVAACTAGVLIAVALRLFCSIAAMTDLFTAAHTLMGQARVRLADHLRRLPMGFFNRRRSGELSAVLTTDLALVEDVWSHTIGVFAASFALPMLVGVGLCFLEPRLGWVLLAALPVALGVLALTTPLFVREVEAILDAVADANARIVEYIQGVPVLRAFGRHGAVYQRLATSMARLRDALIRSEVLPSPLLAAFGFVVELSFVGIAWVGAELAFRGAIEREVLLVFLVISVGVVRQVADLGVSLLMLRASQRALHRVEGLLAESPLAETSGPAPTLEHHAVTLEDVSFSYGEGEVLQRVSATFPERSLTALVGPSGSGKSTLVHLIARLWDLPPGQGTIRIGGVDVRALPFEALHRHLSMVFQDVVLFSGTILENLRIGKPDATRAEVEQAARDAQAHTFISALPDGYDTVLADGGQGLSGGERQRLSIARALLKDAPIVLLDEATASVDASAEVEIQRAIDALVRRKTVVVIAHRLRTIQRAHRILVLENGRVVEQGTHTALLGQEGLYAALWREQQKAKGWRLSAARRSEA